LIRDGCNLERWREGRCRGCQRIDQCHN